MTYSIVARDPANGEMGIAIQTAVPGVGMRCVWAAAGVGVVATQSWTRASHGASGLALMRNGHGAREALAAVVAADGMAATRQLGVVDADGDADAFTGDACVRYADHVVGDGFATQANMMARPGVPEAMAEAYQSSSGPLALRLVGALEAAQAAGGDFRGQQSAALRVVSGTLPRNEWDGLLYDIRVDDHATPVAEVRRLTMLYLSHHEIGEAFTLARAGDIDGAMVRFHAALDRAPDDSELGFLFAVEMATTFGRPEQVTSHLRGYFRDARLREYFHRLAEVRFTHAPEARRAVEALMPDNKDAPTA